MTPEGDGPVVGRALGGRYRLDQPLARGGMAQVWKGTDLVLGRKVAIKMLHSHLADDPAFSERFRREAQAAARLNHPRIVAIYDSVTEEGVSALILEYVKSVTLRVSLDEGQLDVHRAIGIVAQVAEALQEAHAAGVVHRDIKPANILICSPDTTEEAASDIPRVRVTDFGIAKALEGADIDLTKTGAMLGTAKYLAPEQVEGHRVDARTDIYGLGVVLYETVTGRVPWRADTDLATAMARLHTDPVPPRQLRSEVTRGLEAVMLRALARDPADRFASAEEFRAALLAADPGPADVTPALPPVGEAPGFLQSERGWMVPALAIAVVVGVLVAAGVAFGRSDAGRSLVDRARGTTSANTTTSTTAAADSVLDGLSAVAYDAEGGDNDENNDLAGFAVDGVLEGDRVWRTQCYPGDFSDIPKAGVGLILTSPNQVTFNGVELFTKKPGWTAEVYVSDRPATELRTAELAAWGDRRAEIDGDATTSTTAFAAVEGRSLMIFFTSLIDVPTDDCFGERPGSHRIDVVEAQALGFT